MRLDRRSLVALALASLPMSLPGCEKSAATADPEAATTSGAATAAAEPEPAAETPDQGCARMLERFGEDVAEAELEDCVAAITTSADYEVCKEAGLGDDYLSCFDSCMRSVSIDPAEYDPGDKSSSPVANCEPGCAQTTCA